MLRNQRPFGCSDGLCLFESTSVGRETVLRLEEDGEVENVNLVLNLDKRQRECLLGIDFVACCAYWIEWEEI